MFTSSPRSVRRFLCIKQVNNVTIFKLKRKSGLRIGRKLTMQTLSGAHLNVRQSPGQGKKKGFTVVCGLKVSQILLQSVEHNHQFKGPKF